MFDDASGCYTPSWPVPADREPRMNVAKFGDGYELRMLDGINWLNTTWKLKWTMRPYAVLSAMDAYLTNVQGASFPFRIPNTSTIVNVFCDKWTVTLTHQGRKDDYGDLDAEFRNANGASIAPALG